MASNYKVEGSGSGRFASQGQCLEGWMTPLPHPYKDHWGLVNFHCWLAGPPCRLVGHCPPPQLWLLQLVGSPSCLPALWGHFWGLGASPFFHNCKAMHTTTEGSRSGETAGDADWERDGVGVTRTRTRWRWEG